MVWGGVAVYLYRVVKGACDESSVVELHAVNGTRVPVLAVFGRHNTHTTGQVQVPHLNIYDYYDYYDINIVVIKGEQDRVCM
jgi:hypothetical protein